MVVSVVDKLLILNLATKEHRKLSYVCVCVELDVNSIILAKIIVSLRGWTLLCLLLMSGNTVNVILVILLGIQLERAQGCG